MRLRLVPALAVITLAVLASIALPLLAKDKKAAQDAWAEGVPYKTDWKEAIDEARTSGKLLFIYNGWKKEGI